MIHNDKVAVVTGGAKGIGQAVSKRLVADGARVVIADIADASETINQSGKGADRIIQQTCDTTSADDISALNKVVTETFGECNILVHCAGIFPACPFEELEFELWRKVININLDSAFFLFKEFLPAMKTSKWGRVISMSSNTFHIAPATLSHYVASKGGLIGLHRVLANEYAEHGVTFNTIAPMLTRTPGASEYFAHMPELFDIVLEWQAIKRPAEVNDLTGAVSFLASDEAGFITGQTWNIDGGTAKI